MNGPLVLSLFPGAGLLDRAFEESGFCVVRGPDPLWCGDVRTFHPPAGRFDGVIGGPPCQEFGGLANLVEIRAGYRSRYGNLIPEFERVVVEAAPSWWVMENVSAAPLPAGAAESFLLSNRDLGAVQDRKRRFSIGGIRIAHLLPAPVEHVTEHEPAVTGAHRCAWRSKGGKGEQRTLERMIELQGLPPDFFDESPFLATAKRSLIGNGVPLPMGRAIAAAVRLALDLRT